MMRVDLKPVTENDKINLLRNKLAKDEVFIVSKCINGFAGFYLFAVDELNEKIGFITDSENIIIDFTDIIGVELIQDGYITSKKSTTRTIGGAIVGGILAGGVGTIVGGLSGNSVQKNKATSIYVKITLRSLENPSMIIKCFDNWEISGPFSGSTDDEDYVYKTCKKNADEIKDLISVIIDRTDNKIKSIIEQSSSIAPDSIAEELIKLTSLKEKGILTDDEFLLQKNKILNR